MLLAFGLPANKSTAQQRGPSVELVAVGDILLDRGVGERIKREGTHIVFARVRETISRASLAFGNLECPLSDQCDKASNKITFRASPRSVESLTDAGLDILSLANNHTLDCGGRGLLETMRTLKQAGLLWCGASASSAEAQTPVILNATSLRVAFIGFTAIRPARKTSPQNDEATVAIASREAIERAVTEAKQQAEVVVVSIHWGDEYASRPNQEQKELAHAAVDAGADVILGHHTHTLEGIELLRKTSDKEKRFALIAYSLGNFVFDSPLFLGRRVRESVILRLRLSAHGLISAEVLPIILENYLPRPADKEEAQSIFVRLTALSAELNTRLIDGRVSF